MTAILALDLASKTGWALLPGVGRLHSGIWNFKGGRFEGAGMRFVRFNAHLAEVHKLNPLAQVFFEEVRRHIGTDAAHMYGGLLATLGAWCEEEKIPYSGVPVGTIKKWATGKGNANKTAMVEAMRLRGFAPEDDNEADALAILLCSLPDQESKALIAQQKLLFKAAA